MPRFGRQHYHRRRAAEERARAKAASNTGAKASHTRLATFHERLALDPTFVPFAKASRSGQPGSYWAAAHLSGKISSDEGDVAEAGEAKQPLCEALSSLNVRGRPGFIEILQKTFVPSSDDDFNMPVEAWDR